MTRCTLECSIFTLESFTIQFIRAIRAIFCEIIIRNRNLFNSNLFKFYQSLSWSQRHLLDMHLPSSQWNSDSEQSRYLPLQWASASSEPSELFQFENIFYFSQKVTFKRFIYQSSEKSHIHCFGIQRLLLHLNSVSGLQTGQLAGNSSLESLQSSFPVIYLI